MTAAAIVLNNTPWQVMALIIVLIVAGLIGLILTVYTLVTRARVIARREGALQRQLQISHQIRDVYQALNEAAYPEAAPTLKALADVYADDRIDAEPRVYQIVAAVDAARRRSARTGDRNGSLAQSVAHRDAAMRELLRGKQHSATVASRASSSQTPSSSASTSSFCDNTPDAGPAPALPRFVEKAVLNDNGGSFGGGGSSASWADTGSSDTSSGSDCGGSSGCGE